MLGEWAERGHRQEKQRANDHIVPKSRKPNVNVSSRRVPDQRGASSSRQGTLPSRLAQ